MTTGLTPARAAQEAGKGGVEHLLEGLLETASFWIEMVAALILLIGAVRFLMTAIGTAIRKREHLTRALQAARLRLGVYILAGLEFLIVADVLFTIANRTLQDLINLAIIATVRTVISYFLGKELEELRDSDDRADREAARATDAPADDVEVQRG